MHRTLLTLCAVAALAGCASRPSVYDETDSYINRQNMGDTKMFTHYYTHVAEVNRLAMAYCAGRGKQVTVQSQTRINEMRMSTTYLCR